VSIGRDRLASSRPRSKRLVMTLWAIAFYLVFMYVVFRWGGHVAPPALHPG
jgi:hypothetical protein